MCRKSLPADNKKECTNQNRKKQHGEKERLAIARGELIIPLNFIPKFRHKKQTAGFLAYPPITAPSRVTRPSGMFAGYFFNKDLQLRVQLRTHLRMAENTGFPLQFFRKPEKSPNAAAKLHNLIQKHAPMQKPSSMHQPPP